MTFHVKRGLIHRDQFSESVAAETKAQEPEVEPQHSQAPPQEEDEHPEVPAQCKDVRPVTPERKPPTVPPGDPEQETAPRKRRRHGWDPD